ncbi:MAG TPA: NrfD/PsrC family molybdoenzyme membrane anchor subunit, partial [Candidatus Deferrimicrobium sp.]|nr:NrfD/PsrC family molybdoenzyme membrane anchor subunit [Candidatus Deferrimicrobium sp.]
TGLLLLLDLEHPLRFAYIFLRPQSRSWLVRGAVFIAGFGAILAFHFVASLAGFADVSRALALAGLPLAALTAVYTAYLFAQAKARDLWQSPLLPPHLLVQAALAGSAITLIAAFVLEPAATAPLATWLAVAAAAHLLLVAGEITLTHPTAHARLAAHEMFAGRFADFFWIGVALVAVGVAAPILGPIAAVAALIGLLAHEHAYVQAGQSVPLA